MTAPNDSASCSDYWRSPATRPKYRFPWRSRPHAACWSLHCADLACAAQDAIWRRSKATQELLALLREYYPGFLDAFAGAGHTNLAMPDARAILAIAPTPALGARLIKTRIISTLRKGGRQPRLEDTAIRMLDALRRPQLRQPLLWRRRWVVRQARCWQL
ncbi:MULTISPECIES: hypothetical protein [Rhodococcus]|uniref:hypothetical protein n=1 Tax=Rhodococcus opacus TaxID=37919 RepID=UPI001ED9554A|nr:MULTISPECIES: hypothetical protein [Rhodococcus]